MLKSIMYILFKKGEFQISPFTAPACARTIPLLTWKALAGDAEEAHSSCIRTGKALLMCLRREKVLHLCVTELLSI